MILRWLQSCNPLTHILLFKYVLIEQVDKTIIGVGRAGSDLRYLLVDHHHLTICKNWAIMHAELRPKYVTSVYGWLFLPFNFLFLFLKIPSGEDRPKTLSDLCWYSLLPDWDPRGFIRTGFFQGLLVAILIILNTCIYVIKAQSSSALKPLLKKLKLNP